VCAERRNVSPCAGKRWDAGETKSAIRRYNSIIKSVNTGIRDREIVSGDLNPMAGISVP
jgi:hypothetical protein